MTWTIRPACDRDTPILAEIYRDGRRQAFTWIDPATFRLDDFAADSEGEMIWLAQAPDGDIAGFISLWAADDFIHMLYVREAWQCRGVGTALLRALPGWPDRPYRLKCLVANARARRFYEAQALSQSAAATRRTATMTSCARARRAKRRLRRSAHGRRRRSASAHEGAELQGLARLPRRDVIVPAAV